ncbi:leukocyte elastase inhibitor [Anabrus simplex]|uniref:leukocyte elastase inhibitor n=1 Tax=Anabrus simplex TaxID=316456 RepID=UPI0035A38F11
MPLTWLFLTVGVWCAAVCAQEPVSTEPSIKSTPGEDEFQIAAVATVNNFGKRVYQALSSTQGNFVISPLSAVLMSLLWGGSGGRTAHELGGLLQLPDDFAAVQIGFYSLLRELQGLENTGAFQLAQRIYLQEGSHVMPEFKLAAKNFFLLSVNEINFAMDAETARRSINSWIEERTRNRIKEPIRPGMVDQNTKMLLVSALYLKARWAIPFGSEMTTTEKFHINLASTQDVQMMHSQQVLRQALVEELDATMLEIPFENQGLCMLIILPIGFSGVRRLESRLAIFNLADAVNRLTPYKVNVSLPKFYMEKTVMLNSILEELGMSSMFQYNANFTGLAKHTVYTSQSVQKVAIQVVESGIEAASFRSGFGDVYPDGPVIDFKANHPFVYMVYESLTGTILFIGRYLRPQ